jgi:hypothetical protein
MDSAHIDELLPFSEEEFYRAIRLVESEAEAREVAAFIVQIVRETNEQAKRVRAAWASGIHEGSPVGMPGWVIEDGIFALLALVSDDLRVRVEAYMRVQWEGERKELLRNGLYRGGGVFLREPTPEVYAEVDAQITQAAEAWAALMKRTQAALEEQR